MSDGIALDLYSRVEEEGASGRRSGSVTRKSNGFAVVDETDVISGKLRDVGY